MSDYLHNRREFFGRLLAGVAAAAVGPAAFASGGDGLAQPMHQLIWDRSSNRIVPYEGGGGDAQRCSYRFQDHACRASDPCGHGSCGGTLAECRDRFDNVQRFGGRA